MRVSYDFGVSFPVPQTVCVGDPADLYARPPSDKANVSAPPLSLMESTLQRSDLSLLTPSDVVTDSYLDYLEVWREGRGGFRS